MFSRIAANFTKFSGAAFAAMRFNLDSRYFVNLP